MTDKGAVRCKDRCRTPVVVAHWIRQDIYGFRRPSVSLRQIGLTSCLMRQACSPKVHFLLKLDLVGAINCYLLKINFLNEGKAVTVELSERTGLNKEGFTGAVDR